MRLCVYGFMHLWIDVFMALLMYVWIDIHTSMHAYINQ